MTDAQFLAEARARDSEANAKIEAERTKQAELALKLEQIRFENELKRAEYEAKHAATNEKTRLENQASEFALDEKRVVLAKEVAKDILGMIGNGVMLLVEARNNRLASVDKSEYEVLAKVAEKDADKALHGLAIKRLADANPWRE